MAFFQGQRAVSFDVSSSLCTAQIDAVKEQHHVGSRTRKTAGITVCLIEDSELTMLQALVEHPVAGGFPPDDLRTVATFVDEEEEVT